MVLKYSMELYVLEYISIWITMVYSRVIFLGKRPKEYYALAPFLNVWARISLSHNNNNSIAKLYCVFFFFYHLTIGIIVVGLELGRTGHFTQMNRNYCNIPP